MTDWSLPQDVDPILAAFSAMVIGTLLPTWEEIPEVFRSENPTSAPWYLFQQRWMTVGLDDMQGAVPSDRLIDSVLRSDESLAASEAAMQATIDRGFLHLGTIQRSYEPKQQHKVAGFAWLASLWFSEIVWKKHPMVNGMNS